MKLATCEDLARVAKLLDVAPEWMPRFYQLTYRCFRSFNDTLVIRVEALKSGVYERDELSRWYRHGEREVQTVDLHSGESVVEAVREAVLYILYTMFPRPKPKGWRLLDKRLVLATKKFRSRLRAA